jgi:hypothetical protein
MTPISHGYKVSWKDYPSKTRHGEPMMDGVFPIESGTRFLHEIEAMPKGKPLPFLTAREMVKEAYRNAFHWDCLDVEPDYDRAFWIQDNWVQWISEQGFHIELTGDEWCVVEDIPPPPAPESKCPIKTFDVMCEGRTISLLTSEERPPILRILSLSSTRLEIEYETGEREEAHTTGGPEYADKYTVSTVMSEVLGLAKCRIKPYRWAA